MCKVSIIVPVYYGEKYIDPMIRQVEACWKCAEEAIDVELLLINDAPDCLISQEYFSEFIEIIVIGTEVNRGVQGARVRGLEYSKGSYILFLDQDDKIFPDYLKSQMKEIAGFDAAVCRAIHQKKPLYNLTKPFTESVCKEYMLHKGDSIISPGQVLLRKEAVSEVWKDNILKNNGADDWLLWLCMMEEGKSFALNDEILFEHVVGRENTSLRVPEMWRSELEVLEIVRENHVLSEEEILVLEKTIHNLAETRMQDLGKFQRITSIYDTWLSLKNKGIHITEYLKQKGYRTAAIYGVTDLGRRLYQELSMDKLEVPYFIDINAPFLAEQVKVCSPNENLGQVDAVIISLVQNERQIAESVKMKLSVDVCTIVELIEKAEDLL